MAAPARSKAADLLGNEVTEYRASGSNALEAHTKTLTVRDAQRECAFELSNGSVYETCRVQDRGLGCGP